MTKCFKLVNLFLLVSLMEVLAITPNNVYSTPTAIGLEKGSYQGEFFIYDSGGLGIKARVGLSKYIYLGVIEYIDNVIGSADVVWHIPGVLAKISFTGQGEEGFNVALGWDLLNTGLFSEYSDLVYGTHLVFTKGFFFFKSQAPHLFSIGSKVVLTREPYRGYLFASAYFRLFPFLDWGVEFDNIALTTDARYHFVNNQVINFNITENFSLKFIFQIAVPNTTEEVNFEDINSRSLVITYENFF